MINEDVIVTIRLYIYTSIYDPFVCIAWLEISRSWSSVVSAVAVRARDYYMIYNMRSQPVAALVRAVVHDFPNVARPINN